MKYNEYFKKISTKSFLSFSETSSIAIQRIAPDRMLVLDMIDNVQKDDRLISKCESYDFLDKIILYSDEDIGIHMRLSRFNHKYANRIHYHRWDYTAYILMGEYVQYFYGMNPTIDMSTLFPYEPVYVNEHSKDSCYSLSHSIVHSVKAKPNTISLCIRGSAFTDRFQVVDPTTNTKWWQYGSKNEASEEKTVKSIPKWEKL